MPLRRPALLSPPSFRVFALLPALAALFAAPAAFAAKGTEDEPFTETVDVRVINVEAVVEDADGNRVQALGIGDFEILVDGKAQPAEYFSEIRDNVATPAAAEAAPAPGAAAPAPPPGLDEGG